MFDASTLGVFLLAALALNLAPGPDVLYVLANSAANGRRGGIIAALGISTGCIGHILLAAFGVAALLRTSALAYETIRILGAGYLLWLAVSIWRSAPVAGAQATAPVELCRVFQRGVITNLFNPKVALFFLAFLPQFTDPQRASVTVQVLLLGLIFITSGTLVNFAYAWLGGWIAERLAASASGARMLQRVSATILGALGVRLLFSHSR